MGGCRVDLAVRKVVFGRGEDKVPRYFLKTTAVL
jgi:hypothetical protein